MSEKSLKVDFDILNSILKKRTFNKQSCLCFFPQAEFFSSRILFLIQKGNTPIGLGEGNLFIDQGIIESASAASSFVEA